MEMKIGVIKGDGIGPEIVDEAMKVLDQTAKVYGHSISYTQLLMGGASIDVNGVPLTEETLQLAKDSDAVLMGSIGGDAKIDQNTFLLEPVSAENLVNNRNSRNFWCNVKGIGSWSLTGHSAEELSKKFTEMQDDSEVTAGFMWQKLHRTSEKYGLQSEILSFVTVKS